MPRKDKTGPEGKGPKTGRGLGDCSPEDVKDIEKETEKAYDNVIGRGFRRGRGGRRGRRIGPRDGSGNGPMDGRGRKFN